MLNFDQSSICNPTVLGSRPDTCFRCSEGSENPEDVHGDPLELSPASNADTPVLLAYNPMAQASPSSVHSSGSSSASPPLSAQLKIFEVIETCCKTEDLETLHKLVEEEPLSLRWRDWNGRSPLGFAALLGNVQVVEFFMEFLKRQGDVREELNFRLRKGRTALMLACEGGNLLVIKMMVEAGADLLAADSANWTPLDAAAFHCHLDIVNYLLSKGSEVHDTSDPHSRTILHLLAEIKTLSQHERLAAVAAAILNHCQGSIVNFQDGQLRTALHEANESNNCAMIRTFMKYGADVNVRDCRRSSPIFDAIGQGHINCVREMLKNKEINLCIRNLFSYTPLHISIITGRQDCVHELIRCGADHRLRAKRNRTPCHLAARDAHFDILEYLLTLDNSDVNSKKWDDNATPLLTVLSNHDVIMTDPRGYDRLAASVATLLRHGADATLADAFGTTPATQAAQKRLWSVVRLLILAGSPWDRAILTRHVRPMFVVTTQKDETDNDETYTYPIRTEPLSSSQTRYIARPEVAAAAGRNSCLETEDESASSSSSPSTSPLPEPPPPQSLSICIPTHFEHQGDSARDKQWCVDLLFHEPLTLKECCRICIRRGLGDRVGILRPRRVSPSPGPEAGDAAAQREELDGRKCLSLPAPLVRFLSLEENNDELIGRVFEDQGFCEPTQFYRGRPFMF